MVLRIFMVVLITWLVHGLKFHDHMTKREIQSVFNVNPNEMHKIEYEVTTIFYKNENIKHGARHRRSAPTIHLNAFNQDYTLYLEENNNLLFGSDIPIFMAVEKKYGSRNNAFGSTNIVYTKMSYPLPKDFKLYHNRHKRAAVAVYTDVNNRSHVNGKIGDELTISAIPQRIYNQVNNTYLSEYESKRSRYAQNDSKYSGSISRTNNSPPTYHVVMKRNVQPNEYLEYNQRSNIFKNTTEPYFWQKNILNRVTVRPESDKLTLNHGPVTRKPVESLGPPVTVYPEILVAVDHETYEIHGRDIGEFVKYMMSFWNAVDLRFRELNKPAVRLHISSFIIPETPNAAPYFENHLHEDNLILVQNVLVDVGQFYKNISKKFGEFDIVLAYSHRKLGMFKSDGTLSDTTSGLAYVEGACAIKSGISAGVITDSGNFNGIRTAAHELAHLMGAPHDGEKSSKTQSDDCSSEDGYIMSYQNKDSRAFHWSSCSKISMREFFTSAQGSCLRNKPTAGKPYRKTLPGKIMSRNEQCTIRYGAAFKSDMYSKDECIRLKCRKPMKVVESGQAYQLFETVYSGLPPPEGTSCAKDKGICLNGECVQDPGLSY